MFKTKWMFKTVLVVSVIAIFSINSVSINSLNENSDEVTIGNQVWMTANLNVDTFRNGDPIPRAKTAEEWKRAGQQQQPAWSYYENDPSNGDRIGKLYNWYAVNDPRGLCPAGWHIPANEEWTQLTDYLGGKEEAVAKIKSTSGWKDNKNGTNESGFTAIPSHRRYESGNFLKQNNDVYAGWWSSTERDANSAWIRGVSSGGFSANSVYEGGFPKGIGLAVRCVRD